MACVFLQKKHDISHDRKMKLIVDIIFSIQGNLELTEDTDAMH